MKPTPTPLHPARSPQHPGIGEAFRFWLKLGFISFGGPTGQIAIMHEELVEKRRWISEARFLHALNYCMLLPGPEAQQLATYCGWLLHRTAGGLVAGVLFVLPSMAILWTLSYLYAAHGQIPWVAAIFDGLKPAVMAIVVHATLRIGKRALKNGVMWLLAACAFVSLFFLHVPFPFILFGAGLVGLVGGRVWPDKFIVIRGHQTDGPEDVSVLDDHHAAPDHARPTPGRALRVVFTCLLLWWAPVWLAGSRLGWDHTVVQEGIFFSKAALVTFGGAYAVLPYVAQHAVEQYQWLSAGQMLDGLGLAETTPGPLVMVLQFVGFMGGWNQPGTLDPLVAATAGALLATWVTFVPCFLWIFLGAPHIEQLRGRAVLNAALSAITAAVVGIVLNLAVWFGWHTLFPEGGRLDLFAALVAVMAFFCLSHWKWSVVTAVLAGGLAGWLRHLAF